MGRAYTGDSKYIYVAQRGSEGGDSCLAGRVEGVKSKSISSFSLTEPIPAGIAVCIGMASTFAYANSTLREQVALKVSLAFYLLLYGDL